MATMPPPLPTDSPFVALEDLFPPEPPPPDPLPPPAPRSPTALQLSDAETQRLLMQLRRHYEEAIQHRQPQETRRAQRYRRYLGDVTLRDGLQPWEGAPQLFLPLTRQTIETLCGRFAKALLGTPETIQLTGVGEEDVQLAWRRQAFQRWQLFVLNDLATTVDDALQDAAIDGLGLLKVYRYAQPYPMPPGLEMLQTIVKYEAMDAGVMLLPPDARGTQYPEARYVGQQLWVVPRDSFPEMTRRGFTLPRVNPDAPPPAQYEPDQRALLDFTRDGIHPEALQEDAVELVEMYEVLTRDDGTAVFVVAHWFPQLVYGGGPDDGPQPHLARVTALETALPQTAFPRPMWPYFPLVLWPQARQLRGMSVPDRLETPQDALNRLAEQMLHLGDITILPWIFANVALTGEVPDLTKMRPGTIVPLDNLGPQSLQIHQPTSDNRHFAEQMQVVRSWAEEDSNVTAFTQGRSATQPNAPRTLGGLSLLLQQGQEAYSQQVVKLARQLSEALRFGYALWQGQDLMGLQFPAPQEAALEQRLFDGLQEGQAPAVPQVRPVQMTGEELSGLFDVRVQVNPDAHLEQQKLLTLGERLDAVLAPVWPEGRRLLWREVWTRLGLQGFDRFYPEFVAKKQSMLMALGLQVQLTQFEMQLLQAGQQQAILDAQQQASQASQGGIAPAAPALTPQPGTPAMAPAPVHDPTAVPTSPDFDSILQAVMHRAGIGQRQGLAHAGVSQTPSTPMNGFTDSGLGG